MTNGALQWVGSCNHSLLVVRHAAALQSVSERYASSSYKCVVLGGGTGGCAMASKMTRKLGAGNVAVIEPNDVSVFCAVDCALMYTAQRLVRNEITLWF